MKAVFIHFTDHEGNKIKTYTATRLKTGMVDNLFDLLERAQALQKKDTDVNVIRNFFKELKALIVAVFGGQFTYDELNDNVDHSDLMKVFNEICANIAGSMQKN